MDQEHLSSKYFSNFSLSLFFFSTALCSSNIAITLFLEHTKSYMEKLWNF